MSSKEQRIEHWARLLTDQQSSGLSMAAWCRKQSIPFSTFDYWRRQILPVPSAKKVTRSPKNHSSPEWLSVSVIGDSSDASASGISSPDMRIASIKADMRIASIKADMLSLRVGKVTVDVTAGFNSALLSDVLCVLEERC